MIPDDYIPSVSEVEKYLSLWNELDKSMMYILLRSIYFQYL